METTLVQRSTACVVASSSASLRRRTKSRWVRSSAADPSEILKHRMNCAVVLRAYPSAMFAGTDTAARRIW